jgi:hypothetical protein
MRNLCTCILFVTLILPRTQAQLGVDLHGQPVRELGQQDTRVVVLFFVASDCPVSNGYIPEMDRIRSEFAARHAAFWWVFPNPSDTAAVVSAHEREYSMRGDTILDTRQTLVHLAHASATPEASVFRVEKGSMAQLYHGRIDDRFLALGKERPHAAHHDLEDAIAAALDGQPIAHPITRPVGCSIVPLAAVSR